MRVRSFFLASICLGAAFSLTSCDESTMAAIAAAANSSYNQPPVPYYEPSPYAGQGNYSPYTPAYVVPSGAQRQHAFDIGYRVAQDDYRHDLNMSIARHRGLFDDNTEEAFRSGYSSGYNQAKQNDPYRQQGYSHAYNNTPYQNAQYSSGYSPYAQAPKKASSGERNRHAYDVGYRVGQDDFHRKLNKSYSRHKNLFDSETASSFNSGYQAGYDKAKGQARR
jgi:hypothetical protein